jgi:hypothetical protein
MVLKKLFVVSIDRVEQLGGTACTTDIRIALSVELFTDAACCGSTGTLTWENSAFAARKATIACRRTSAGLFASDGLSETTALSIDTAAGVIAWDEWFPVLPLDCVRIGFPPSRLERPRRWQCAS